MIDAFGACLHDICVKPVANVLGDLLQTKRCIVGGGGGGGATNPAYELKGGI